MSEDTRDIEAALGSLRPRRLPAGLESRLTAALEAPPAPARPRVIPWLAWGGLAAAACLALVLSLPDQPAPAAAEPMAMAAASDTPMPMLRSAAPPAGAAMRAARVSAPPAPEAGLQLVRAEQSPAEATLLEPVRLSDGLFARPVRVRWHNTAHFRDASSGAELIRHAPHDEVIGLVPFETD